MRGLSHLSDTLFLRAYISKVAFKKTILRRIALSQANIEALERRNEFFRGLEEESTPERAMSDEELDCIRNVLEGRGINEADIEIEYLHAVYEDELVAFSIADMQLAQMVDTGRIRPQHDSGDNSAGGSSAPPKKRKDKGKGKARDSGPASQNLFVLGAGDDAMDTCYY